MVLRCIAVILFATLAFSAWGQPTTTGAQDNAPGAGGTSKPGVSGAPGSKSGPAAGSQGSAPSTSDPATTHQDPSGVRGMPGSKSGPATNPPLKHQ
jgi:hypothetical protein